MDLLLQDSTLINSFTDKTERAEALQDCKDRFESIYETYTNTAEPVEDLLEKVIDMYLFLGIEPSAKLMEDVKKFLLEGKTFSKLDIYMHLPQYDQIVKLLRPEYYVEVDPGRFNQFTASETIYNLALQEGYNIEDSYKNAYSTWYIDCMLDKCCITCTDMLDLLTHAPWECVKYSIDKSIGLYCLFDGTIFETNEILTCIIKMNYVVAFKYYLEKCKVIRFAVKIPELYDKPELYNYVKPIVDAKGMSGIIHSKNMDALLYLLKISPVQFDSSFMYNLLHYWPEAFEVICDKIDIEPMLLRLIYNDMPQYLRKVYDAIAKRLAPDVILVKILRLYSSSLLRTIHGYNPIDLSTVGITNCIATGQVDYFIEHGFSVTESDLLGLLSCGKDRNACALLSRYTGDCSKIYEYAVKYNCSLALEHLHVHEKQPRSS